MGWRRRWMSMHSSPSLQAQWEASLALHPWTIPGSSHRSQLALLRLRNREAALLFKVISSFRASNIKSKIIISSSSITTLWTETKDPRRPFIDSSMSGPRKIKIHGSIWMINHRTADRFPPPGSQYQFLLLLMTSPSSPQDIIIMTEFSSTGFLNQRPKMYLVSLFYFIFYILFNYVWMWSN